MAWLWNRRGWWRCRCWRSNCRGSGLGFAPDGEVSGGLCCCWWEKLGRWRGTAERPRDGPRAALDSGLFAPG